MDLSRRTALIRSDSIALATAARRAGLDTAVPSCPGWTVRDLLAHIWRVHRFWHATIEEGRSEPIEVDEPDPPDDDLIDAFADSAVRFIDLLAATDPGKPCWTWGNDQNAGFVQRFQVQEAALHRWDAENAAGTPGPLAPDGAADSIEMLAEMLPEWYASPPASYSVEATDAPMTASFFAGTGAPPAGTLRGPAGDLLLVLWRRLPLETVEVDGDIAVIRNTLEAAPVA